jgi:hypothetical protein
VLGDFGTVASAGASPRWVEGQLLGPGVSGGEVHHKDPLCFERRLVPR